jgi:hypothetical protein
LKYPAKWFFIAEDDISCAHVQSPNQKFAL